MLVNCSELFQFSRSSKNSSEGSFLVHSEGTTPWANDLPCGTKILREFNFVDGRCLGTKLCDCRRLFFSG